MTGQYTIFLRVCFVSFMATNAFHITLQCGAQNTDTILFRCSCKGFGLSTALCRGSSQEKPKLHISHKSGIYEVWWFVCWSLLVGFFSVCVVLLVLDISHQVLPRPQCLGQVCLIFLPMTWTKGSSVPSVSLQKTPSCFLQLPERMQMVDVSLFSQVTRNKTRVNGLKLFQEHFRY